VCRVPITVCRRRVRRALTPLATPIDSFREYSSLLLSLIYVNSHFSLSLFECVCPNIFIVRLRVCSSHSPLSRADVLIGVGRCGCDRVWSHRGIDLSSDLSGILSHDRIVDFFQSHPSESVSAFRSTPRRFRPRRRRGHHRLRSTPKTSRNETKRIFL